MFEGNNGFGALGILGKEALANTTQQELNKINASAGAGSQITDANGNIDQDKSNMLMAKAYEDGARDTSAQLKAADHMFSGAVDKNGRDLYDRDFAAEGQAMQEMAKHQQNMQTAIAASQPKTGEQDGYADFITGMGAQARKSANEAIGIGEKFGAMDDKEQIDLMRKVKENSARGFEGGIKGANEELHAGVDKDGNRFNRSVDQAIADDITGGQEKGMLSSAHASNLREKYGSNLKGSTTVPEASEEAKAQLFDQMLKEDDPIKKAAMAKQLESMISNGGTTTTLAETLGNIDQSKIDSQIGQGAGIQKNMEAGVNYAQNAMYGEMSNQQSTMAKLDQQGGVNGAVNVDVTDAKLKAATQQDVLDKNLTQAGADKGIREDGINKLNDAIDKLAKTAGTMAAGKTGADIASVDKYDSTDQYVDAQAQKSSAQATIDKTRLEKSEDQEQTQAKLDALISGANDKKLAVSQAMRSGAVELDENGNAVFTEDGRLKATTGNKFTDALSMFGAGDMQSTSQLIMGGQRVNIDTDMDGNTLTNRDSQENLKRGRKQEVGVSGYPENIAGVVGEVLAAGVVGTATLDGAYRKFGPKGNEGIVKPLAKGSANALAGLVGAEKPFPKTPDQSVNPSEQGDQSKSTNPAENDIKNEVHDTPPNKDTGSVPKTDETVKPSSIAEQISDQYNKELELNKDEKYLADKNKLQAQFDEQNRLNGGHSPERDARFNRDMAALQDQHFDRISKHKGALEFAEEKVKNQSWLDKNFGSKSFMQRVSEGVGGFKDTVDSAGAKLLRGLPLLDTGLSGLSAYGNFTDGDNITGTINSLNASAAASFAAAPNPITGAVYGATSIASMYTNAFNDTDNTLKNLGSQQFVENRNAIRHPSAGGSYSLKAYGDGQEGSMVFSKMDNGNLSVNGNETGISYSTFQKQMSRQDDANVFANSISNANPSKIDYAALKNANTMYGLTSTINTANANTAAPDFSHSATAGKGYSDLVFATPSPAPAYAQKAFSTPSGFNTMSAMGGTYANPTPTGYKKDMTMDQYEMTSDLNRSNDIVADEIAGLKDVMSDAMKDRGGENGEN